MPETEKKSRKCKSCESWAICMATQEDHIVDGKEREIVGCDHEKFHFGRLLKYVPGYWRLKTGGNPENKPRNTDNVKRREEAVD